MSATNIAADSLIEADTVVLVVAERARRDGKYTAHHNGALVVDGVKEPFLDAARVLLAQGLDPNSRYVMRRSPNGPDALVSTLGVAAGLTIEEGSHGPIFRRWKPWTSIPAGMAED